MGLPKNSWVYANIHVGPTTTNHRCTKVVHNRYNWNIIKYWKRNVGERILTLKERLKQYVRAQHLKNKYCKLNLKMIENQICLCKWHTTSCNFRKKVSNYHFWAVQPICWTMYMNFDCIKSQINHFIPIYGNGIWKSPKDADDILPLNRKRQSLAQELFCTDVSRFLYQNSSNSTYEI